MNCDNVYKKLDIDEDIQCGDLVALVKPINKVTRAVNQSGRTNVIGVCINIDEDDIQVQATNVVALNTDGIICIGDKVGLSNIPGKARAIKYESLEERQFNLKSVGKVIGLYNIYNLAQVLLDIE